MKRILMALLVAVMATTAAGAAFAGTWTPRIDRREARQHARIHQGMRNGTLTPREWTRLRVGQRHVRRMEWRAKSDGHVGPYERRAITRAQNRQSWRIHRLKHNGRGW